MSSFGTRAVKASLPKMQSLERFELPLFFLDGDTWSPAPHRIGGGESWME